MGLDVQVGTTTIASAVTLTANYALMEDELQTVDGTNKWFQLYGETQTVLELSYTTGAAETNNYVEFYIEYGSGSPANIDWARETMEYFDDSANQIVLEPWTYKLDGASAATEYTVRIPLPVCTKGIRIYAKEVGVAANFGTFTIKANTQAAGAQHYNRNLQTVTLETGGITLSENIAELGGETLGDHGSAVIDHGIQPLYEAADYDGSALPNAVTEGQAVRPKTSLSGVTYVMPVNEDGSAAFVNIPPAEYVASSNGRDGTVVYASASTLTLSGTPFTVNNEDLAYVKEVDATGNTANVWVNGIGGVHLEISSGTITKSGGSDFSANGVYELGYNGQKKAYNAPTDANQVTETSPIYENYVGETLADVTNETDGTNYYYVDMAGYKKGGFQFTISGGSGTCTVTLEGTLQDDGTAAASCTYIDITNGVFGVASITASDIWNDDAGKLGQFKYVRLKTVTSTGGANDADYTIYHKRLY